MTLNQSTRLADAIRYLDYAHKALIEAGQPLLALRLGAVYREADVRRSK